MKKLVGLVIMLSCSLTAAAQLKISISEITLKDGGTEVFESYSMDIDYSYINRYITIEADVYNDSFEAYNINTNHSNDIFAIEYQFNSIKDVAICRILNPVPRMDGILSIPSKSTFKLRVMVFINGLNSDEYIENYNKTFPEFPEGSNSDDFISNFIKIYPTITLKFADEDMNKLVESSKPIKAKNFFVKSESAVAAESNSSESIEPDSDESTEPGTVLYI